MKTMLIKRFLHLTMVVTAITGSWVTWNIIICSSQAEQRQQENSFKNSPSTVPQEVSPLMYAISKNDVSMVKKLLDLGRANISVNRNGTTPLHLAVNQGNMTIIQLLLEKGANVSAIDSYGQTPVMIAIKNNQSQIISLLENTRIMASLQTAQTGIGGNAADQALAFHAIENQKGTPIKAVGANETALLSAAISGDEATIKTLLDQGTNPNVTDKFGRTPLTALAARGRFQTVKLLIAKGADVNMLGPKGESALIHALKANQPEITKYLLEKGADAYMTSQAGESAVMLAAKSSNPLFVQLFKNIAPPIGASTMALGNSVIPGENAMAYQAPISLPSLQATEPSFSTASVTKITVDDRGNIIPGQTVSSTSQLAFTNAALFQAIETENISSLKNLLDQKVDVNMKSADGSIPLIEAAKRGNPEMILMLLEKGADVRAKNQSGDTALMTATRNSFPAVIGLLKEAGAVE